MISEVFLKYYGPVLSAETGISKKIYDRNAKEEDVRNFLNCFLLMQFKETVNLGVQLQEISQSNLHHEFCLNISTAILRNVEEIFEIISQIIQEYPKTYQTILSGEFHFAFQNSMRPFQLPIFAILEIFHQIYIQSDIISSREDVENQKKIINLARSFQFSSDFCPKWNINPNIVNYLFQGKNIMFGNSAIINTANEEPYFSTIRTFNSLHYHLASLQESKDYLTTESEKFLGLDTELYPDLKCGPIWTFLDSACFGTVENPSFSGFLFLEQENELQQKYENLTAIVADKRVIFLKECCLSYVLPYLSDPNSFQISLKDGLPWETHTALQQMKSDLEYVFFKLETYCESNNIRCTLLEAMNDYDFAKDVELFLKSMVNCLNYLNSELIDSVSEIYYSGFKGIHKFMYNMLPLDELKRKLSRFSIFELYSIMNNKSMQRRLYKEVS